MKKYSITKMVLLFLIILIPLSDSGFNVRADESEYYNRIKLGLSYFRKVYERIQSNYVEEIDPYEFAKAGIEGMLQTLDPYTVFIEQEGDTRLRIITTGKYGGLGMEIGMRNGRVTIISPMNNSPAERAGIQAGDMINKIDGESVATLSPEIISKRLRGPVGTDVEISVERPGFESEFTIKLVREEIVIEDVSFADFIAPGLAYFRLTGFTDKAGEEFTNAVKNLQNKSEINAVIVDLRGNSGGLLESAVDICGIFLPKGTTVVYTKGLRDGEHSFMTNTSPLLPDVPLAVLVNGGSASASEIVAGALQDLDRAIIVGTNTFGKGLVQKVYNIDKSNSTKVKVTTAKYYIPSGRCVQKEDYSENNIIFNKQPADTTTLPEAREYFTSNHRKVYEKGGVMPDIYVKDDSVGYLVTELWRNSIPFNFAVHYKLQHPEWKGSQEDTDHLFADFLQYTANEDIKYYAEGEAELEKFINIQKKSGVSASLLNEAQILLELLQASKELDLQKHKNEICRLLINELAEKYYGSKEKFRYTNLYDIQLQSGISILQKSDEYRKILTIN